jgi:hypothetical protein
MALTYGVGSNGIGMGPDPNSFEMLQGSENTCRERERALFLSLEVQYLVGNQNYLLNEKKSTLGSKQSIPSTFYILSTPF